MPEEHTPRLTEADLDAEEATLLPSKEVLSVLDLNANIDLALDVAAPIDLAVAGNLNVAAPIDAAASANVLSTDSVANGIADQDVAIDQGLTGEATAHATQVSDIAQGEEVEPAPTEPPPPAEEPGSIGGVLDGNLLNVNVDVALDTDLAAPIGGAVALNGNVAAPIDAAVAANIGSVGSEAGALADQDAVIVQRIDAVADATSDQDSSISQ